MFMACQLGVGKGALTDVNVCVFACIFKNKHKKIRNKGVRIVSFKGKEIQGGEIGAEGFPYIYNFVFETI